MDKTKNTARKLVVRRAFVTYLKFHRLRSGKFQSQMARECRIAQSTYCDIENGFKEPGADLYPLLAKAIDRPVEELVAKLNGVSLKDMMFEQNQPAFPHRRT